MATFMNACMQGKWEDALYWQDRLARLHRAMFLDSSPAPAKYALAQLGLCTDEVRLPITPCAEEVNTQPEVQRRARRGKPDCKAIPISKARHWQFQCRALDKETA